MNRHFSSIVTAMILLSALGCQKSPQADDSLYCTTLTSGRGNLELCGEPSQGHWIAAGDIMLPPRNPQLTAVRAGLRLNADAVSYWPNGVIPFEIAYEMSRTPSVEGGTVASALEQAMNHIALRTPVRFVPAGPGDTNKVRFQAASSGCYSQVGMRGGTQYSMLSSRCSVGSIIHELGHVIGLLHEQSRSDRDNYVSIAWENVDPRYTGNFSKFRGGETIDDGEYDFDSVMHYPADAFAIVPGLTTIRRLDGKTGVMGQRAGLSPGDIRAVDRLYRAGLRNEAGLTGRLYPLALRRNASLLEWQYYSKMAPEQVASRILGSEEHVRALIRAYYLRLLKRLPEAQAEDFQYHRYLQGASFLDVVAGIAASTEFQSKGFIESLYRDLLNRLSTSNSELAYWRQRQADGMTASQIAVSFVKSDEFLVQLASECFRELSPGPATPAELSQTVGKLRAGHNLFVIQREIATKR